MFPVMSKQQGYNAAFVNEIPQDLMCVICSLVLRDPIQVIDCGHRFCSPCFKSFVEYSKDHLVCPIDRQPIEKERVFGDKGMTRTINSLNVKCVNEKLGCDWKGCLGDLDSHEASCNHKEEVSQNDQYTALNDLCKQLCERLQRCEEKSDIKEKELAYLRFAVKELKEKVSGEEELKRLKEEVAYLKVTLRDMKEESCKSREQIKSLEDSVNQLGNEVNNRKRENEEITGKCTNEMEMLRKKNDTLEKQIQANRTFCKNESKSCIEVSKALSNRQSQGKIPPGEIKDLKTQLKNIQNELRSKRSHRVDNTCNKCEKIGGSREVESLQRHVRCLENNLFFNSVRNQVELKWVMENFTERRAVGSSVSSPIFYPQVAGYCFQIFIYWQGAQNEYMDVNLILHRGVKEDGRSNFDLQPFQHEYTLEVFNKTGGSVKYRVTRNEMKENLGDCFSISPQLDEAEWGFGAPGLIKAPFDDYVTNDAVYIKCTLHL